MSKDIRVMRITEEMLRELLQLPVGAKILQAKVFRTSDRVSIGMEVQHPDFALPRTCPPDAPGDES